MTSTHVWLVSIRRTLLLAFVCLTTTAGVSFTTVLEGRTVSTQPPTSNSDFSFFAIDVPGSTSTVARGLNNLGHIVGSYVDASGHTRGFVLKEGVFATIDGPQSEWTIATGINNAGEIVGAYGTGTDTGNHGFVLNRGVLTTFDVPESVDTIGNGVNNAGQIVGSFQSADGVRHGFLLRRGVYTTIDVPNARSTSAEGINDAEQIVGRSESNASSVGFLLVDGSFLRIEATAGVYSSARGLNSQGDIVGQDGDPATAAFHGFARIGGRFPVVNGPTAALSWNIQGINDLGLIVGEVTNGTGTHGYLGRPAPDASVFTTDDTRLPVEENPRASAPSDALPGAQPKVVAPVVTLSLQPGESTGSVRWNTAVGSPAAATFIARHVGNSSNGEVHVNNHDGVSFSGTISCYHQSGPRAAWFSGTIDRFEGRNTRGNRQGTTTFIMSVTAADPSSHNNGRVTLVRGSTPFDCSTFHDGRQPVTAGAVITALR